MYKRKKKTLIQWHPAFCSATELEFYDNMGELEFHPEYLLGKKPLQADLLIKRIAPDVPIQNEIGHIFRTYNILEYKSPDDALSVDDFYKVIAYASLYKCSGKEVNLIPSREITISIFRDRYPRKLFSMLQDEGMRITEYAPGIYYIEGSLFPTQIIVTSRLLHGTHESLRMLSRDLHRDTATAFLQKTERFTSQGAKDLIDSILQVSISANYELYSNLKGGTHLMCPALRELMKDYLDQEIEAGVQAGINAAVDQAVTEAVDQAVAEAEKNSQEASFNFILNSINNLTAHLHLSAQQAVDAMGIPASEQAKYLARL